jgi:hypothetical protein
MALGIGGDNGGSDSFIPARLVDSQFVMLGTCQRPRLRTSCPGPPMELIGPTSLAAHHGILGTLARAAIRATSTPCGN